MTHVTSAFQKNGSRGEQRSTEVKNSENRSNFKLLLKWINCISKWRSWRQLSKKVVTRSSKVTRGQNLQKRSNFELWENIINHISKWRSWRKLSYERCLEVIQGHLRSKIPKKVQILNFVYIEQIIYQNNGLDVCSPEK